MSYQAVIIVAVIAVIATPVAHTMERENNEHQD
jgi:hypothetical protein